MTECRSSPQFDPYVLDGSAHGCLADARAHGEERDVQGEAPVELLADLRHEALGELVPAAPGDSAAAPSEEGTRSQRTKLMPKLNTP